MSGVLRFVSVLVSIFEKENEEKNCPRYFEICKYAFLIFEKGNNQKIAPGILRFVSIHF